MAIARVNTANGSASSDTATVASGAQSHTTGNGIIGWVTWEDADRTISVADTAGNNANYQSLTQPTPDGVRGCMFYCPNITGHASNIVTVTLSGNAPFKNLLVAQYSGLALTSLLDQQNTGSSLGSSSALTSTGTVTTTQADELLCVGGGAYGSVSSTPGANWTEVYDPGLPIRFYERIVTGTGTYQVVATAAHADRIELTSPNNWVNVIGAFKAAAGGGATSILRQMMLNH